MGSLPQDLTTFDSFYGLKKLSQLALYTLLTKQPTPPADVFNRWKPMAQTLLHFNTRPSALAP